MVYTNEFRIARIISMLVVICVLGAFLPQLYWLLFEKGVKFPFVLYSPVKECFFVKKILPEGTIYFDSKGDTLSLQQYREGTPLFHYRQLIKEKKFPDSLNGQKLDLREVNLASFFRTTKPREITGNVKKLYPLFESATNQVSLEMPPDFFRLGEKIEFMDVASNQVLVDKSLYFQSKMKKAGVCFPVKKMGGLPTIRKTQENGYFFQDSANQLFQLKMVDGFPDITFIENKNNITFRYIKCVDLRTHEWFAYLVSTKNELYVLAQNYELYKLPVEDYHPEEEILRIDGDLLYFTIVCEGENFLRAYTMNKKYELIKTFSYQWETNKDKWNGMVFSWIFPFSIHMTDKRSIWKKPRIAITTQGGIMIIHLFFFTLYFGFMKRRGIPLFALPEDCIVILVSGIYGFLAFLLIPDTPLVYLKK